MNTTSPTEDKISAATAAELLGVSVRTIDRYQAAGMLTPAAVPIRPRKFRLADVHELLHSERSAS